MTENKNNVGVEEGKNDDYRKDTEMNMETYYHPFWSLLNDCFSDNGASDIMRTDITSDENGYKLEIEVPGVDKKDIRLQLNKGYLTIQARTHKKEQQNGVKYIRTERTYGSFSRSFYLGNMVKREDIEASSNDGILTITIKKPEEVKQEDKFIEVK